MKNVLKFRAGAKIGPVIASWPSAKLVVTEKELSLDVKYYGSFKFNKNNVSELSCYTFIPFLLWGVKIKHSISKYEKNIVVLTFLHPKRLIKKIDDVGFNLDN